MGSVQHNVEKSGLCLGIEIAVDTPKRTGHTRDIDHSCKSNKMKVVKCLTLDRRQARTHSNSVKNGMYN